MWNLSSFYQSVSSGIVARKISPLFSNLCSTMAKKPVIQTLLNGSSPTLLAPYVNWDVPFILGKRKYNKYAVLILNRPVSQSQNFMKNFWNSASVRITIDGGTAQWDRFVATLPEDQQKSIKLPDMVTGDFDSIPEEIMNKYKKKGCKTVHTPDQDYTDFTKALIELYKFSQEQKVEIEHVIAIGQGSGRLDQTMGNIQTLYLAKEKHLLNPNTKVYLMTDDAISWLIPPGRHVIKVPKETLAHSRSWCSLVPIGEPCLAVSTTGLKWDLDGGSLKFGELVSTSNAFRGLEDISITCSHTLLWSMRLPHISGK